MEESIRIILEAVQRAKGELDSTLASINKLNASNKASESAFARVNRVFKENTKLLRDLGIAAGVAGAALAVLIKNTINTADAMGKQAKAVNATVEAYSRLAVAADINEVSQQELFVGLNQLNRALVAAQDQGSKEAAIFKELGVATTDANGKIRSTTDVLLDVSDAFAKSESAAVEATFAQELFGKGGRDFVNFLNQGRDAIQETAAQADLLGATFSGKTAEGADQFNDNLTLLKVALTGIGNEVISQLLPSLISFTNVILDVARDGTTLKDIASVIVAIFRTLAQVAIVVVGVFRALGIIIGQGLALEFSVLEKLVTGVIQLFITFGQNIGRLILSIVALVKSVGSLGDVFSKVIKGDFKGAADAARNALATVQTAAADVGKQFTNVFAGTGTVIEKTATDVAGTVKDITTGAFNDIVALATNTKGLLTAIGTESVAAPGTPAAAAANGERRDLKPVKQQAPGQDESAKARALQAEAELVDFRAQQQVKLGEFRNVEAEMLAATQLRLEATKAEEAAALEELQAKGITDLQTFENEKLAITRSATLQRLQIEQQYQQGVTNLRGKQLDGARDTFANIAIAAKAFGKEGFLAYKIFASAAALVDTYKAANAAYAAMAGIPYVGPALGIAAAAAAVAAGLANVAAINSQGFAEGGLVPGAPSNTDNRLAMVATGEYIFDAASVSKMGPGYFAAMHAAIRSGNFPGFASGGLVPRPVTTSSFQSGGFVGGTQQAAPGVDPDNVGTVNFAVTDTRNQMREFQRKEGVKLMIDLLQRRSSRVFA